MKLGRIILFEYKCYNEFIVVIGDTEFILNSHRFAALLDSLSTSGPPVLATLYKGRVTATYTAEDIRYGKADLDQASALTSDIITNLKDS